MFVTLHEHVALWQFLYFDSSLKTFRKRLILLWSRFTGSITALILRWVLLINKYQPLAFFPLLPAMLWDAQDIFCHSEGSHCSVYNILRTLGSVPKGFPSCLGRHYFFIQYHLGISLVSGFAHQGVLAGFQTDSDETFCVLIHFHSQVNLAKPLAVFCVLNFPPSAKEHLVLSEKVVEGHSSNMSSFILTYCTAPGTDAPAVTWCYFIPPSPSGITSCCLPLAKKTNAYCVLEPRQVFCVSLRSALLCI